MEKYVRVRLSNLLWQSCIYINIIRFLLSNCNIRKNSPLVCNVRVFFIINRDLPQPVFYFSTRLSFAQIRIAFLTMFVYRYFSYNLYFKIYMLFLFFFYNVLYLIFFYINSLLSNYWHAPCFWVLRKWEVSWRAR